MDAIKLALQKLFGQQSQELVSPMPKPMTMDQVTQQMVNNGWKVSNSNNTPTPSPAPTSSPIAQAVAQQVSPPPNQQADPNFRFAYEQLARDPNYATEGRGRPNFTPSQPPADIGNIIRSNFPKEATQAALIAATENAQFDPNRPDNINANGSADRGIFQVNEDSFNGLMQRQSDLLKKHGITSFDDMHDKNKNAFVATLIQQGSKQANPQTNGFGPWYGWQDTGYDINNKYFSQPNRIDYEVRKRGK